MITRTDARGVTTTLAYDIRKRIAQKTYSDSTPSVTWCYDGNSSGSCAGAPIDLTGALNLKDHLTRVTSSVNTRDYSSYDGLGRVLTSKQSYPGGSSYPFVYTYNDVALKTIQYPSLRVATYTYDSGGRPTAVSATQGSTTPYVTAANYAAWGGMEDMTLANGTRWERTCYNQRTEVVTRELRTQAVGSGCPDGSNNLALLSFTYATGADNGNLQSQTISDGASWSVTQNYTAYDAVNRLVSVQEPGTAGWQETFGYDQWGNRWVNPAQTSGIVLSPNTPTALSWFTGKNRPNLTNSFDRAGNQLKFNPYTLTYDAENRQTSATSASNGSATYAYDGEGRRVTKVNGATTTSYVYDAMGNLAAEYEAGTPGTSMPCSTCYLFTDHLGSTRAVWDSTGVKARYDYLPFGEDIPAATNGRSSLLAVAGLKQKFTAKERDAETGLDYFGARYFSATQGRFISPDKPFADQDPDEPQSWNLYSYVRNNPLTLMRLGGRSCMRTTASEPSVTSEGRSLPATMPICKDSKAQGVPR